MGKASYVGGGFQIRMVDTDGDGVVIAGTGTDEVTGDGEPAGGAELSISGMEGEQFGAVWFTGPLARRLRVLERFL